jgi:hypothetical protein
MSNFSVCQRVTLDSRHRATGKTEHRLGSKVLPKPHSLSVCQYVNDPGYYLFYYDAEGRELTDTYHDTIESALAQAQYEFGVDPRDWTE